MLVRLELQQQQAAAAAAVWPVTIPAHTHQPCPAAPCAAAVMEFNIQTDPEAARIVFESGVRLVMVPLEVTHTALVRGAPGLHRPACLRGRMACCIAGMLECMVAMRWLAACWNGGVHTARGWQRAWTAARSLPACWHAGAGHGAACRTTCEHCTLLGAHATTRPACAPALPIHPPPAAAQVTTSVLQRVRTHQPSPFLRLMTDLLMFFSDTYATGACPATSFPEQTVLISNLLLLAARC